jgi:SprT protein
MKYITVSRALEQAVLQKVNETMAVCHGHYSKNISVPTIKFRQIGRRAGTCRFNFYDNTSLIVINPDFFKNYYDDMLNDTVPHEVAHHVSAWVHGRKGYNHSWLWKGVMNVLGIPAADRCHEYSLEGVKVRNVRKPYKYSCGCDTPHFLTELKHVRQQRAIEAGRRGCYCLRCRKSIVYQGFTHNGAFIPSRKLEVKHVPMTTEPVFVPKPEPVTPVIVEPQFRTVTKFIGGMLVNVKVPLT